MDGLNQRDVTQAKETHHFQSVTLCLEVTSFWYLSVHPSIHPDFPCGSGRPGGRPSPWVLGRRLAGRPARWPGLRAGCRHRTQASQPKAKGQTPGPKAGGWAQPCGLGWRPGATPFAAAALKLAAAGVAEAGLEPANDERPEELFHGIISFCFISKEWESKGNTK